MVDLYDRFYETFQGEKEESGALLEERREIQTELGATNEELIEEMKKQGITCIKMDAGSDDPDAKPLYVRLTENKKRTRPISIKTIGDTLFGRDEEEDGEEEDHWAQKVEEAYAQVQDIIAARKEKEKKQKAEDKKRMEKRKRKVKEIKKRKAEEDAKKLKKEEE